MSAVARPKARPNCFDHLALPEAANSACYAALWISKRPRAALCRPSRIRGRCRRRCSRSTGPGRSSRRPAAAWRFLRRRPASSTGRPRWGLPAPLRRQWRWFLLGCHRFCGHSFPSEKQTTGGMGPFQCRVTAGLLARPASWSDVSAAGASFWSPAVGFAAAPGHLAQVAPQGLPHQIDDLGVFGLFRRRDRGAGLLFLRRRSVRAGRPRSGP